MSQSSTIKTFIFITLLLIFAFLFWQKLAFVYLQRNLNLSSLLWLGAWFLFFLIFLLFFSLLVESKLLILVVYFLTLTIFFCFFSFHYALLIGLAILFLIFILSRALMQKERNNHLKISIIQIFKKGLPLILTFFALFFALLSYFYPLIKIDQKGISLSPQILEWLLQPLTKNTGNLLPFFEPEMTINETIAMTIAMQKPDLSKLSPEILKKFQGRKITEINPEELLKDPEVVAILKNQAKKIDPLTVIQQRNELAKNLGLELKGNEKIAEIINQIASKKLNNLLGPYLKYLPIIFALLTFFLLKIIFVPFSWLVIGMSLLFFQILLIFRLVRIEKVMKEGEDVRL
ncbi:MAG: hypothetical protein N2259_02670 [Patescibacteria group bacterium]|nr:hypothetical protein [Patescibacteria group bacterium]